MTAITRLRIPLASLAMAALAVVVVVSRRPDAVANPQFWAEDGAVWFANAHNQGWIQPFLTPHTGYYQTLSRTVGLVGDHAGLATAPLIANAVALVLQVLPALFVLSRRFERVIPSLGLRFLLGALYLAIPNSEIHANITNAMSHLAILALMVVLATPSPRWWWRAADVAVLVLCGLSGPFIVLLAPAALAVWLVRRDRWKRTLTAVAGGLALVQGLAALSTLDSSRTPLALAATPALLGHILVDRVLLPGVLGQDDTPAALTAAWSHSPTATALILAGGAIAVALAVWRGPLELRLLLGFAVLVLALELARPQVSAPQWPALAAGGGTRYFLIPVLAWVVTLVWLCTRVPRTPAALLTGALVVVFTTGDLRDWSYPAFTDLHPATQAAQLSQARPGTTVTIPINPPGWVMILQRR